jgi:hypothetical protein
VRKDHSRTKGFYPERIVVLVHRQVLLERACLAWLAGRPVRQKPSEIDRAADALAVNLLRMFGLPESDAREVAARRLPRAR